MKMSAHCRCNRKLLCFLAILFFCAGGTLSAQDCEAIVLPMMKNDASRLAQYPSDKIAYHCTFSQLSFEVSDTLPAGVPVYEINEVRDVFTGVSMDKNVKVDLNTLSYYQYDFNRFQGMHANEYIYFHTVGSEHLYLVLVPLTEVQRLTVEKMKQLGY